MADGWWNFCLNENGGTFGFLLNTEINKISKNDFKGLFSNAAQLKLVASAPIDNATNIRVCGSSFGWIGLETDLALIINRLNRISLRFGYAMV